MSKSSFSTWQTVGTVFVLLAPGLLGLAPALAAGTVGGPTSSPHFTTVGVPGTGTQTTSLVLEYEPDPSDALRIELNELGYDNVTWTPREELIPAAGLDAMVTGVSVCAATPSQTDALADCVPLTQACPQPEPGPATFRGGGYCLEVGEESVTIHLGLVEFYTAALEIQMAVAKQPTPGEVPGNVVALRNVNWEEGIVSSATVAFTTAPVSGIAISTSATCPDPDVPAAPDAPVLTADETRVYYAYALDGTGACLGPASARWSVLGGIGAIAGSAYGSSATFDAQAVGHGSVFADDLSGHNDTSDAIVVLPGATARVAIVDAQGVEVEDVTLTADDAAQLFAATVDADGNPTGSAVVDWSVASATGGACGSVAPASGPATLFDATTIGTVGCAVSASAADVDGDSTGVVTVTPGAPVGLSIRHGSPSGALVGAELFLTGTLYPLAAASEDADGNAFDAPATTTWTFLGGCGSLDRATGPLVRFAPARATSADDCRIVARTAATSEQLAAAPAQPPALPFEPSVATPAPDALAAGPLAASTPALSVASGGSLAYLRLRSQPGNGGVAVHDASYSADEAPSLCAAGYDADFRYLGDVAAAAWTLTPAANATLSETPAACVTLALSPVGALAVKAAVGAVDETADLTITPGVATVLRVLRGAQPANLEGLAGGAQIQLAAVGRDQHANDAGPLASARWALEGDCATLSSTSGASVTLDVAYVPAAGCALNVTAPGLPYVLLPITIATPTLDHIRIVDADGFPVTTATLRADETLQVFAAGFDVEDNFIGALSVDWAIDGGGVLVGASPATSVVVDPRVADDDITVTATIPGDATKTDEAGPLHVAAGALSQVRVETKADGTGIPVGERSVPVGGSVTMYAIGRDADANLIAPVTVDWSMQGCVAAALGTQGGCFGTLSSARGFATTFTATAPGNTRIVADDGAGRSGRSGLVTVLSKPLVSLDVELSADGVRGQAVDTLATTADQNVSLLCARGMAAGQEDQGYQGATWTVSGSGTGVFEASGACVVFDPKRVGEATVRASIAQGEAAVTDDVVVTIQAGALVGIAFDGAPATLVAGTPFDASVIGVDADGNAVPYSGRVRFESNDTAADLPGDQADGTAPGSVAITPASTPLSFTLRTAGERSLRAVDVAREGTPAPFVAQNDVLVSVGALSEFEITNLATQVAGVAFSLQLRATDSEGNTVTTFTGEKTLTGCGIQLHEASDDATVKPSFSAGVSTTLQVNSTTASSATGCTALAITGVAAAFPALVVDPAALDHFDFSALGDQTARVTFPLTITAKDIFGNTRRQETGAITLTGTAAAPVASGGSVSLTAGTVTASSVRIDKATTPTSTDLSTTTISVTRGAVTSSTNAFKVNPGALHHYRVTVQGDPAKTAGVAFTVEVKAEDQDDSVRWQTTTAPVLSIPANAGCSQDTPAMTEGIATYTLTCIGSASATTLTGRAITGPIGTTEGSNTFSLKAAAASQLVISTVAAQTAGAPFSVTVSANDPYGNRDLTSTATGTLTSANCDLVGTTLPFTLASGTVSVANVNLTKADAACVLAASATALTDGTATFAVRANAPSRFLVTAPATGVAGEAVTVTIQDLDAWNNVATAFGGDRVVTFSGLSGWDNTTANATATDGAPVPFGARTRVTFANGLATVALRLPRAGAQTIALAENPADPRVHVLTGTSGSTTIAPAAHAALGILSKNATTIVGRDGILASESVNGRAAPFAAQFDTEYVFHAGSFDEFDNLRGAATGRWFDHGTINGAPTSSGTTFTSSFAFTWLATGADEVELLPRGQTTQGAVLPGSAALAVQVS